MLMKLTPGDEVMDLLLLMTSKNPDADLSSKVMFDGGYNPCSNDTKTVMTRRKREAPPPCGDGFVLDVNNSLCYMVNDGLYDYETAFQVCSDSNANILYFEGESQVEGFMNLVNSCKHFFILYPNLQPTKLTTTP
jgi:hypothetical protein